MKKGIFAVLAGFAVFFLALAGCDSFNNSNQNPEETVVYIVVFEKNTFEGNKEVNKGTSEAMPKNRMVVSPAKTVDKLPAEPTWQKHQFVAWYTTRASAEGVVFDVTTPVTGNMTVYARWLPYNGDACTVTFNSNGGSAVPSMQIDTGKSFSDLNKSFPTDPTREGYIFKRWSLERGGGQDFTLETKVNDEMTVYAQWEKEDAE
jgi:uncharacterized repeat protein (TIGR02543 family)